jgi:hypothetical protein
MLLFRGRNFNFLTEKYPYNNGAFETLAYCSKRTSAIGRAAKEGGFIAGVKRGTATGFFCGAACIIFLRPAWRRHHSKSMSKRQPNGKERTPMAPRDE